MVRRSERSAPAQKDPVVVDRRMSTRALTSKRKQTGRKDRLVSIRRWMKLEHAFCHSSLPPDSPRAPKRVVARQRPFVSRIKRIRAQRAFRLACRSFWEMAFLLCGRLSERQIMPGCEASGSRNASRVAVVYALKDKDCIRAKARKVVIDMPVD